jgi:ankyrin repeat protein
MIATLAILAAADSTAFLAAIRAKDLARVEAMLRADPALASARDEKGSAVALALAVRRGEGFTPRRENRLLEALLRRSPQLSAWETFAVGTAEQVRRQLAATPAMVKDRSPVGWTPLHYAAFADNASAAALLIGAGAEVDARAKNKFDNTPLQVAMLAAATETAKVLLDHGADVNAVQAEGVTALHEAASAGDLPSIRVLLAAGADPRSAMPDGKTPVDLARAHKHAEAVRLLSGLNPSHVP